ncbi:hypothetical protein PQX77_018865 [Marasmius sp. AFHP31]|nr:hypothetical protein PQX77_018865 [Marasmius sp. AFHP31]
MPNVRTIEDHFCDLLYKLYKHWPYHEDYSAKLTDHSLIPSIPLDLEREALLGLLLQQFFLSQHISIHWGYVACFNFQQAPIYFYEDNLSGYIPFKAQNVIDMVAEAITCVGFLGSHMAFFQYNPLMACWVTHPSYHHNFILHEEFYLNKLN